MPLPSVKLVTWTHCPIESVYHVWEASKTDGPVPSVKEIEQSADLSEKARKLFWNIIHQKIPVGEHINFVFMLENVSVSFREQMVRHRVGTKVGDRIGVDIIPDLDQSSWWSQSMRIQDMGTFADRELFRVPESLKGKSITTLRDGRPVPGVPYSAEESFRYAMQVAQNVYNDLVKAGVPMEDAREVIPLGAQHRISWALNLQTLLHVLGKRGCWILQLGLWGPIIKGMIEQLATLVDPMFRNLLAPPCVNAQGKFDTCLYPVENQRRIDGRDDHPICPLYVCRDSDAEAQFVKVTDGTAREFYNIPYQKRPVNLIKLNLRRFDELTERAEEYRTLWGKDPYLWDIEAQR